MVLCRCLPELNIVNKMMHLEAIVGGRAWNHILIIVNCSFGSFAFQENKHTDVNIRRSRRMTFEYLTKARVHWFWCFSEWEEKIQCLFMIDTLSPFGISETASITSYTKSTREFLNLRWFHVILFFSVSFQSWIYYDKGESVRSTIIFRKIIDGNIFALYRFELIELSRNQ